MPAKCSPCRQSHSKKRYLTRARLPERPGLGRAAHLGPCPTSCRRHPSSAESSRSCRAIQVAPTHRAYLSLDYLAGSGSVPVLAKGVVCRGLASLTVQGLDITDATELPDPIRRGCANRGGDDHIES